MHLPSTPEEVIAFVGHNFCSRRDSTLLSETTFTLTVHDLLSAFADLQDNIATDMTEEQERESFEAWAVKDRGGNIRRAEDSVYGSARYASSTVQGWWQAWKGRAALSQPASTVPEAPTVEQAISSLVTALAESKGWMRDYADSVVRDAVDRKMKP